MPARPPMIPPFPAPVIVVPGITASALRDEYPVDPERVWSFSDAASGAIATWTRSFERVALHPEDLRFELREPARVRPDALFHTPYGELIHELRHNLSPHADQTVPVYPFAYDWRHPLEPTEHTLATFIDEVIDRTRLLPHYHAAGYGTRRLPARVHLVGHSMGGLVIGGYLARYGPAKVDKIATLGSPFRGSHEAVLKVATGLATLGAANSSSREREVARLTPALYHLLPSYADAVRADASLSTDLFHADTWQPAILATLREHVRLHGLDKTDLDASARRIFHNLLTIAATHRQTLERLALERPSDWLCIVGVGNRTRVRLHIESRDGTPYFDLTSDDRENRWIKNGERTSATGDGTVPFSGARCAFIPPEQVVCICPDDLGYWEIEDRVLQAASGLHPVLPKINLVHRLVASHLLGRRTGEIWGRRSPEVPAGKPWLPPIAGLIEKDPPRQTRRPRKR